MVHIAVFGLTDVKGGVERHILNYFLNMNRSKIQYHIFAPFKKLAFEDEFLKGGAHVYHITKRTKNPFAHYMDIYRLFKKHPEINIIHCHVGSAEYCYPLLLGKILGIGVRIIHSHGTQPEGGGIHKIVHYIGKPLVNSFANVYFACSEKAGNWLFYKNKKVEIVPNAIEITKFLFNPNMRGQLRKLYNINNYIVIGHVGRFCEAKNHKFMIQIIRGLSKKTNNIKFFFIGEGELKAEIMASAEEYHLEQHVCFLDFKDDIYNYYNMFDCFILPSLFEGFPVSVVEAALNGLPCIISDTITLECKQRLDRIQSLSIENPTLWEMNLSKVVPRNNELSIRPDSDFFDIHAAAPKLMKLYEGLLIGG